MSRSYWRYVAAIAGLITISALMGYGVYEVWEYEHQSYSPEKYQPARDARFPISVSGTKVSTTAYQPNCQAPQTKDNADLCSQWQMVQASEENNRLLRLAIGLASLEFVVLIVSLGLSSWAALTSAKAASAALTSVRPWLDVKVSITGGLEWQNEKEASITFKYEMRNVGKSPAIDTSIVSKLVMEARGLPSPIEERERICARRKAHPDNFLTQNIFPEQVGKLEMSQGLPVTEIDAQRERMNIVFDGEDPGRLFSIVLVGCALYRFNVGGDLHCTQFMYDIGRTHDDVHRVSCAFDRTAGNVPLQRMKIQIHSDGMGNAD